MRKTFKPLGRPTKSKRSLLSKPHMVFCQSTKAWNHGNARVFGMDRRNTDRTSQVAWSPAYLTRSKFRSGPLYCPSILGPVPYGRRTAQHPGSPGSDCAFLLPEFYTELLGQSSCYVYYHKSRLANAYARHKQLSRPAGDDKIIEQRRHQSRKGSGRDLRFQKCELGKGDGGCTARSTVPNLSRRHRSCQ